LEQIIAKALEKDRELRYRSASDMRTDLQRLKRDTDSASAMSLSTGSNFSATAAASLAPFCLGRSAGGTAAPVRAEVGNFRDLVLGVDSQSRIESIAVLPVRHTQQRFETE